MRILVTGKDGQVGRELCLRSWPNCELVSAGRAECDLSDPQSIRDLVRQTAPQVIVNAAAYTAVDRAEKERDLCFAVNATAPGVLAEEAARLGALLIHYSTDYVFNGAKVEPYVESDAADPLGVYGASKAAGEAAVASAANRYLLLRTSWVYSAQGKNFLRTMLRLAAERPELRVVDDQIGAPTSAGAIAMATARLVEKYMSMSRDAPYPSGIYHMTASDATSWYGFAQAIFGGSGGGSGNALASAPGPKPQLVRIATADYPTPAKRPKNSVLSNDKFEAAFGFRLNGWQEQLEEVLAVMRLSS